MKRVNWEPSSIARFDGENGRDDTSDGKRRNLTTLSQEGDTHQTIESGWSIKKPLLYSCDQHTNLCRQPLRDYAAIKGKFTAKSRGWITLSLDPTSLLISPPARLCCTFIPRFLHSTCDWWGLFHGARFRSKRNLSTFHWGKLRLHPNFVSIPFSPIGAVSRLPFTLKTLGKPDAISIVLVLRAWIRADLWNFPKQTCIALWCSWEEY